MPTFREVMSEIKKIDTDDDWDGIGSAAQIVRHFNGIEVSINHEKGVPSDSHTLILDKDTVGDGWVIDHHPTNKSRNILILCKEGNKPTATLVYEALPKKDKTDLFIAATAEITDSLHNICLEKIKKENKDLFKASNYKNQYMREEEIFSIASVLAFLSKRYPYKTLEISKNLNPNKIDSVDSLINLLNNQEKSDVKRFLSYMENFNPRFDLISIGNYEVKVADEKWFEFPMSSLERMLTENPGNYVFLKGDRVSIRSNDINFINEVLRRFQPIIESYGGRVNQFGIKLKKTLNYDSFLKILNK
ncbi:MAG: hypothetical protein OH319_02030 [Candidatus Parvarchaeota archaeon]|nr:hypothetical protein [Candidatus Jingweiarchaeum tengchongense]MCW1298148.1 hypothetical protein [Candidatus Jingweiarchaeum tengchongense]MCW1305569.1 hypothetical protein [Candidatus Jingweiarchaeum tengchongense]